MSIMSRARNCSSGISTESASVMYREVSVVHREVFAMAFIIR